MIIWLPDLVGVYVTGHEAMPVMTRARLQSPVIGLKLPGESLENRTVPVGVVGRDDTSVTVAVQDVAVLF